MKTKRNFLLLAIAVVTISISCVGCLFSPRELTTPPEGTDTFGYIKSECGKALAGVVVTDGFTVTTTDESGLYALSRAESADFIYYSLPAGYEVSVEKPNNVPTFFKTLEDDSARYDFSLKKLPAVEERFELICIGDPQVRSEANIERFKAEVSPDILKFVKSSNYPCYALTLGDIVDNTWDLYPGIVEALSPEMVGVPVFQTIGNHDHEFPTANDDASRKIYESFYGPSNYSFNRGKAHIISMDNVQHGCEVSRAYNVGFTKEQFEWLKSDLSYVDRDQLVIFAVHVPFRQGVESGGSSMNLDKYYHEVLALLAEYPNVQMLSAHTHTNINYIHEIGERKIFEHITGTTCGSWWNSTVCSDGTPIGYSVMSVDGNQVEWVYKAINHDKDFQIRLYRSTDSFSGGKAGVSRKFENEAEGRIIANVWNWDPEWSVKVYEDDKLSGEMTQFTGVDAWVEAYHRGVMNKSAAHAGNTYHLFSYDLKNPKAKVRVEATDRFGNLYQQSVFTDPNSCAADYNDNY